MPSPSKDEAGIANSAQWLDQVLDNWQLMVWWPAGARELFLLEYVQTNSGAHPPFYSVGIGRVFYAGKVVEAWSWPLTSSNSEVKNEWNYTSTPPTCFTAYKRITAASSLTKLMLCAYEATRMQKCVYHITPAPLWRCLHVPRHNEWLQIHENLTMPASWTSTQCRGTRRNSPQRDRILLQGRILENNCCN